MNKVGVVTIGGKKYFACLSTRVLVALEDRNGRTTDEELNDIFAKGKIRDLFWLLAEMLKAGYKDAKKMGEECPEPPSLEDLLDETLVTDYKEMFAQLKNAVQESSKSDVEFDTGKNALTTQDA